MSSEEGVNPKCSVCLSMLRQYYFPDLCKMFSIRCFLATTVLQGLDARIEIIV